MHEHAHPAAEGITTRLESPEPCKRVIKAEIQRAQFDQAYAAKLKEAQRGHQKPGFRKGRTPKALVEKEMGHMLRVEAIESLVPKAWMAAVLEHRLVPLTDPALENLKFEDTGPLTFDLVVEVRPEVTARDYVGLPVRKREVEVTPQDVQEVLERLRESRARFEPVQRPAQDGDQIVLDLTPRNEAPDAAAGPAASPITGQRFILGSENNLPEFNAGLQGCAAAQERSVAVTYPPEHPNERLKGRTVVFDCRVTEVGAKVLPDLDDAFAADVEPGTTLEDLRRNIQADLEREARAGIARELDHQLQTELVRRNEVPLPPSMVQKYLESGLEEFHRRNRRLGRPDTETQDAQYLTEGRPHAERALQGMLLLEAVRRQEGIKVDTADVDERIGQIAAENGFDVDRYREFVNSGEEKERIVYDLLERRTYDFLLGKAEVRSVPAETDVWGADASDTYASDTDVSAASSAE